MLKCLCVWRPTWPSENKGCLGDACFHHSSKFSSSSPFSSSETGLSQNAELAISPRLAGEQATRLHQGPSPPHAPPHLAAICVLRVQLRFSLTSPLSHLPGPFPKSLSDRRWQTPLTAAASASSTSFSFKLFFYFENCSLCHKSQELSEPNL